jgi:multidrug efflux system membrane fusion protein
MTPRCRAAAMCALLAACRESAPKKPPAAPPVRVAAAVRIDAPTTIISTGVVQPMQTVDVTAQVSGTLKEVLFKEGDYVREGQPLFRLDSRELRALADQARATLVKDEAQAEAAHKDDVRYRRLASMGYVSQSQADQFHATAKVQAATVEADRAALRAAEVNLGFTTMRAPISGRTGVLLVRRGNNVSPTSGPIVVINQISPVLVRFPILSQDFPAVQRAVAMRPVDVIAAASDSSGDVEHGVLRVLNNEIDSLTGTVMGKATFANPRRRLWPGELVFLTVQLSVRPGAIAVPTAALLTGQQGSYVYVVDARTIAQTRPVTIAQQVGPLTVVTHGVAQGERVVVDGQSRIKPGARVALLPPLGDTATVARPMITRTEAGEVSPYRR